MDLNRFR